MNEKRCYVSSTELGGQLYAIGGSDDEGRLKSAERYDPIANKWSSIPSMSLLRSNACSVAYNIQIYVIGG